MPRQYSRSDFKLSPPTVREIIEQHAGVLSGLRRVGIIPVSIMDLQDLIVADLFDRKL